MPLAAYAVVRSRCTQAGKSAHWASRAGKWRTAVRSSPEWSREARVSSTSCTRVIAALPFAARTARECDMGEASAIRLFFANVNTRRFAVQYAKCVIFHRVHGDHREGAKDWTCTE